MRTSKLQKEYQQEFLLVICGNARRILAEISGGILKGIRSISIQRSYYRHVLIRVDARQL